MLRSFVVCGYSRYFRHFLCVQRHGHTIGQLRRNKARKTYSVNQDVFQRVIVQISHLERYGISGLIILISSRYFNRCRSIDTRRLRNLHRLTGVTFLKRYNRYCRYSRCVVRKRYRIVKRVRVKRGHCYTIQIDSSQLRVLRCLFNELNLIHATITIDIFYCQGRNLAQTTFLNRQLVTSKTATRETGSLILCVRQRSCTTHRYDTARNRCCIVTKRIHLLLAAVRVKATPKHIVNVQTLNLIRINQLYIIYPQTIIFIQTAVSAEVRIVTCRENNVTLTRNIIVHVINRYGHARPVSVFSASAIPSFCYLFSRGLRRSRTLVSVHCDTHIRLFIRHRHIGTLVVLVLISRTFRCACPRVEQQVEILAAGVITRTLNPYNHGVRTIFETDTTIRTRSCCTGIDTLKLLP